MRVSLAWPKWSALNSGCDEALLSAKIARIHDQRVVDLDVLGFSGIELDRLLAAVLPALRMNGGPIGLAGSTG
jgi:hypothetical protein